MSSKVLLAQLEPKIKSLLNDQIYPIIESLKEKSKKMNQYLENKIEEVSAKNIEYSDEVTITIMYLID